MKKLLISVCALGFALCSNAQAVVDNAVIPVSVNINSIMRMNVVSGGNIEFSFNTIDQYTKGISNSPRYNTKFTVASSVDFKVSMYTEDANFLGADNSANIMGRDLVGYSVEPTGTAKAATTTVVTPNFLTENWSDLSGASSVENVVVEAAGGDAAANAYTIHWSCGDTDEGAAQSVLSANLAPDRYSTNVFLVLAAQ